MGTCDHAVTLGPVMQACGVTESGQLDVSSTQATGVHSFSNCVVPGSTVGGSRGCKDCCGSTQGLRIRSAAGTRADRGGGGASGVHVRCCRDLRSGRAGCRHAYRDGFQVRQQGLDPTADSLAAQKSWLLVCSPLLAHPPRLAHSPEACTLPSACTPPSTCTPPRGTHTAVEARDGGWAGRAQVHGWRGWIQMGTAVPTRGDPSERQSRSPAHE